MHKLEELLPGQNVINVDHCDAILFDGHASIQTLLPPTNSLNITFQNMAEQFLKHVTHSQNHVDQIHVVFDRYLDSSIKSQTRQKRGATSNTGLAY